MLPTVSLELVYIDLSVTFCFTGWMHVTVVFKLVNKVLDIMCIPSEPGCLFKGEKRH